METQFNILGQAESYIKANRYADLARTAKTLGTLVPHYKYLADPLIIIAGKLVEKDSYRVSAAIAFKIAADALKPRQKDRYMNQALELLNDLSPSQQQKMWKLVDDFQEPRQRIDFAQWVEKHTTTANLQSQAIKKVWDVGKELSLPQEFISTAKWVYWRSQDESLKLQILEKIWSQAASLPLADQLNVARWVSNSIPAASPFGKLAEELLNMHSPKPPNMPAIPSEMEAIQFCRRLNAFTY